MKRQLLVEYRGKRSQSEMAAIYGVSQQLWSCWENGVSAPVPHIMKAIAIDSGIPMDEIFFDLFNQENWLNRSETK